MPPLKISSGNGAQSGFLFEFAARGAQGIFACGTAALGNFPRIKTERVAILTDEKDVIVFNREYADGDILEVNYAVNSLVPSGRTTRSWRTPIHGLS
jgi:hypothetical protein